MTKKSRDEFKYVKTHNELLETLVQKFDALQTHGASFDAGKTWQALTLAGEVQMLVGDGTKQSLLRLLGIQKTLRYPDTARSAVFEQEGWIGSGPMTAILLNENHPRCVPHCFFTSKPPWLRLVDFRIWWKGDVLETSHGKRISRERLTRVMRNKEGGGHVDGEIDDADYQAVKTDYDPQVRISSPAGPKPLQEVHFATMRQIAWELEQALQPVIASLGEH